MQNKGGLPVANNGAARSQGARVIFSGEQTTYRSRRRAAAAPPGEKCEKFLGPNRGRQKTQVSAMKGEAGRRAV
jgi:hypothetical protein